MCTLTHAFDGKSLMAVMYKIVEGEVPKLPEKFSSELNNVLKLWVQDQCIVNFEYTDQTPFSELTILYNLQTLSYVNFACASN